MASRIVLSKHSRDHFISKDLVRHSMLKDLVSLGRLARDTSEPEGEFLDPAPAANLAPGITETTDFVSVRVDNRGSSAVAKFLQIVSLGRSKRRAHVTKVESDSLKRYRLKNATDYFQEIIQLEGIQKWIEEVYKTGGKIYLLVGFETLLDAVITEYEAEFTSLDLEASTKALEAIVAGPGAIPAGSASIEVRVNKDDERGTKFTAKGEQVFTLQYQEVKVSVKKKGEDLEFKLKESQWMSLTKYRQAHTPATYIMEAEISEPETGPEEIEFNGEDIDDDDERIIKVVVERGHYYL